MNNLPTKTTIELIQQLESGQIDLNEAAKRIASFHVVQTDNYSQTLVFGIILAGIAWAVTGTGIIPAVIGFLTWDSFRQQRDDRKQALQHIARGKSLITFPMKNENSFQNWIQKLQ
jgi:hypothetical protein